MPILDSNQRGNDKAPASADNTNLLDDSLNYVKKHPVEVATGAGLALGAIVLSKGKVFATAEKEIAPLTNLASERGTINFAKGTVESVSESTDPILLNQIGYGHVPMRDMAANIRMQQGVIMRPTEGPSRIVFGNDHAVQHILFDKNASLAEKAAGTVQSKMFGFIGKPVERMATPEQMFAGPGSKDMLEGASTLKETIRPFAGPGSKDMLDSGRHIMSDASSAESGWNNLSGAATKALEENGLALGMPRSLSPVNEALATNPTILNATPWTRSSAIEGGAEYLQAQAQHTIPQDANQLVVDAWYGTKAQAVTPEVVNTISAITLGIGKEACRDFKVIDQVATTVGAHGQPQDYIQAYKAIQSGGEVLARMTQQIKP